MHHSRLRRSLLLAGIAIPFCSLSFPARSGASRPSVQKRLADLENGASGRLGVALIDTSDGSHVAYRGDERFPFCSTFKIVLVGCILKMSMQQSGLPAKHIDYNESDLLSYAPVARKNLGQGMSVAQLCAAALQYSDNTAANLLLKESGGLEAVNAFARSLGDRTFRLDRWEPDLNSAIPDDPRDTTTPAAMAADVNALVLGDVLGARQREQLAEWLKGNTTGNSCIRAGTPAGWVAGDKTGSGDYGTTNDVAVLWPPGRAPLVLAIYFTRSRKDAEPRRDVLAEAARLALEDLS